VDEGGDILRETGATPTESGLEEFVADAAIESDAFGDLEDICTDAIANIGDFINETNFGREEGIRGIFDHLGGVEVCFNNGNRLGGSWLTKTATSQGGVEFFHQGDRLVVAATEDNAIGIKGVMDRGTFPQEFRITDHIKLHQGRVSPFFLHAIEHNHAYPIPGTNRHSGFVHNHFVGIRR
jgi:hypothetical protein